MQKFSFHIYYFFGILIANILFGFSCVHEQNKLNTNVEAKNDIRERTDFAQVAGPMLCNKSNLDLQKLWQQNIFDAQVVGYFAKTNELNKLRERAIQTAKSRGYRGYAVGVCSDSLSWFAVLPASKPYLKKEKLYEQECDSLDYLFAPTGISGVVKVKSSKDIKESGTLAVYCNHKVSQVLWYMLPIMSGPQSVLIFAETISGKKINTQQNTLDWVNKLRAKVGLAKLTFQYLPKDITSRLSYKDFYHQPQTLHQIRSELAKTGLVLQGENRVVAESLDRALWQLWNSPSHRELLLSKNIQSLYVEAQESHTQISMFMLGFSLKK